MYKYIYINICVFRYTCICSCTYYTHTCMAFVEKYLPMMRLILYDSYLYKVILHFVYDAIDFLYIFYFYEAVQF